MRRANVRNLVADINLAARRLRRTPAFTIVAILLLGVGMAIAAATTSLVNVALFRDPARDRGLVHLAAHLYVSDLPDDAVRRVLANPPRSVIDTSSDWRVWLAVGSLTLGAAFLVVARLSWRIVRVEALGPMVATGGMGGATIRTADTSARLVVAQSAATAALLLVAALLVRNALPASIDLPAASDRTIVTWIAPDATSGASSRLRGLREVSAGMSDVHHAALLSSLPGTPSAQRVTVNRDGVQHLTNVHYVGADAPAVFGMPVRRGRTFTAREDAEGAAVALVTETASRRFWRSGDPIGQRLSIQRTRDTVLDRRIESFRTTLQRAFPDTGLVSVRTMRQEIVERSLPPRSITRIIGLLGSIVFLVAMGGLYGLMSYLAAMRRREIGIRKAVGATGMALVRMFIRESTPMLGAGIGIGMVVGLMMSSLFVRDSSFRLLDPVAIVGVAGFLYAAGLLGSVAPYTGALRERAVQLRE